MWLSAIDVGETFATGGITAAIGLAVTFLMLAVLIVIVMMISKIEEIGLRGLLAKIFPKLKKKTEITPELAPSEAVVSVQNDTKLIAAITAAISVMLDAEGDVNAPKASFKVKSIKRI